MPYNGIGTFEPLPPPDFPAVSGELIKASEFNAVMADVFEGLSSALPRDGQGPKGAFQLKLEAADGAAMIGRVGGGTVQDFMDGNLSSHDNLTAAVLANLNGTVDVPLGTHTAAAVQLSGTSIRGRGLGTIIHPATAGQPAFKLGYINTPSQWARKKLENLTIDGNSRSSDGLVFGDAANPEISGRWAIDGVTFTNCIAGVRKPTGNIGNSYTNCQFGSSDYGVFALSQASPGMHSGNDSYKDTEFDACDKAGAYYKSTVLGSGGLMFGPNTIFQFNPGFGVMIDDWTISYTPVTFDGVWFESNASLPTVVIEGETLVPVDLFLRNVAQAVMRNGMVPKVRLVNSSLTIDNCFMSNDSTVMEKDAASTVIATNMSINGGAYAFEITSIASCTFQSGGFAAIWQAPPRALLTYDTAFKTASVTFVTAETVSINGGFSSAMPVVSDGRIFSSCNELTIPASGTAVMQVVGITAGKWAVWSLDIKPVSGAFAELDLSLTFAVSLAGGLQRVMEAGRWKTIAGIAPVTSSGNISLFFTNGPAGAQVLRISAWQLQQFDTEQEAVQYYNSGAFVI